MLTAPMELVAVVVTWLLHSQKFQDDTPISCPFRCLLQMRALMYVAALTAEIMKSMSAVESAWEEAAAHQTTIWQFPHLFWPAHPFTRQV